MKRLGLDIGSTTLKCVVIDDAGKIRYSAYKRHYSKIAQTAIQMLDDILSKLPDETVAVSVSGSAGMGVAEAMGLPFIQEVYAEREAVKRLDPDTDVVIELGGEDAKILFLSGGFEMRMNGTCAGGTGAFIDQMASLMQVTPDEMDALARNHTSVYTIASRCGVFAKSDIQPLLNQGAKKEDISAGIFYAVANQTVAGLAQGREIKGRVLYLGGPLTFLPELRRTFDDVLKTCGRCPENSLYYVAVGAAISGGGKKLSLSAVKSMFTDNEPNGNYNKCAPLFHDRAEYDEFLQRHKKASEGIRETDRPSGDMYLGIDAGSTTVKAVMCDDRGNIFRPFYSPNNGNPVTVIKKYLEDVYAEFPDIRIKTGAATGYGEEIIKNAFHIKYGIVETIAHYTAAKKFRPDVDFILDIGGQDIKCFQIRNGAIDNIYLNEACSSGCGSFLQTFAGALGYTAAEFAQLGLFADAPVDLGSRCTVFMNSSVKQAQKDGASVENIAAGLSISVVKNALYKVIRCASAESLGKNVIVQGGTFLSDSVLRAFEMEIGANVIRPKFSELMGAYGAALYAQAHSSSSDGSGVISADELKNFTHDVKIITCNGCTNHCRLTVNTFDGECRYIAGNRCDKPVRAGGNKLRCDLFEYKLQLLAEYCKNERDAEKPTVGLPLGLNMYELLPFWHAFFTDLGFNVLVSPFSTRKLYVSGQHTIPSDTVCYPAKLMHGHIEYLIDRHPDVIFYPSMSYNTDEKLGVNHFNCPVVAYYPQVLKLNVSKLDGRNYICDFLGLARKRDFSRRMTDILARRFPDIKAARIKKAARAAYAEYDRYFKRVRAKADEFIAIAKRESLPVVVLAGRPYHVDPEINHGINSIICKLGAVVISEDSVSNRVKPFGVRVRNQWTYHARLYAAAKYVADAPRDININLVQLVSFGCGVDAITGDEVRSIIESAGKIYTQIKIDEISNMGAVTIRLRSLFSALEDRDGASPDA